MTVRTLQIDAGTGGLVLKGGQLVLLSDGDAIAQACGSGLRMFAGEWFLAPEAGTPWFENVLVKNPDTRVLYSTFRDRLLSVQGVAEVVRIDLRYDSAARELTIDFRVRTDAGLLVSGSTQVTG